jgi:hypothetical protein
MLHHIIEPAAAREAFVHAAHAAGMPVLPDDMAEVRKGRVKKDPTNRPGHVNWMSGIPRIAPPSVRSS